MNLLISKYGLTLNRTNLTNFCHGSTHCRKASYGHS